MSCSTHTWATMRPGKYQPAPGGDLLGRLYTCQGECGGTLLRGGELPRKDGLVFPAWLYILAKRRPEPAPASLRQLVRLAAGSRRERRQRCARRRARQRSGRAMWRAGVALLRAPAALTPDRTLSPDWMLQALRARVADWLDHLNTKRGAR